MEKDKADKLLDALDLSDDIIYNYQKIKKAIEYLNTVQDELKKDIINLNKVAPDMVANSGVKVVTSKRWKPTDINVIKLISKYKEEIKGIEKEAKKNGLGEFVESHYIRLSSSSSPKPKGESPKRVAKEEDKYKDFFI